MAKHKHGMNPITFRQGNSVLCVTFMRMGLGTVDNMRHTVTIAFSDDKAKLVLGVVQVSEDKFIDGLGRLFPRGELDGANMEEGPEDKTNLLKELAGLEDLTRNGEDPFSTVSAYHTAMARLHKIKEILEGLNVHVGLGGAVKELVRLRFMDKYGHLVSNVEFGIAETLSVRAKDESSLSQLPEEFEGHRIDASTNRLPS